MWPAIPRPISNMANEHRAVFAFTSTRVLDEAEVSKVCKRRLELWTPPDAARRRFKATGCHMPWNVASARDSSPSLGLVALLSHLGGSDPLAALA
jgi:hypothetical protein